MIVKTLTELQACETMKKFLEKYYHRTASDDVGSLLGDLQMLQDGITADPAAWNDWIHCIQEVLQKNKTL